MQMSESVDEWRSAWARVWSLVDDLDDEAAGRRVPACPDWSVRDLVSHMVGLLADVLNDREAGDDPDAWTAAQVSQRSGRSLAKLHDEWQALERDVVDWMYANNARPLGDVVIHEQDLRGALEAPGGRSTAGLRAVRDRMAGGVRAGAAEAGLAPLALVGEEWTYVTEGDVEDAAVVLRAADFDLARAVMTRRSENQLRAWTERGDVAPYLGCFEALGSLPDEDLVDG